jgi:hypothetical protein
MGLRAKASESTNQGFTGGSRPPEDGAHEGQLERTVVNEAKKKEKEKH